MNAAAALRDFLAPILPGWRIQLGLWTDGPNTDRFAVIKPSGGGPAMLVREPKFAVLLIGGASDGPEVPAGFADTAIEAMRASSGGLVYMQPFEPVAWATNDGRPVSEFAVSAITH